MKRKLIIILTALTISYATSNEIGSQQEQVTPTTDNRGLSQASIVTGFLPVYRELPEEYDLSRLTHLIYFSIIPSGDGSFSWTSGRDSLAMYNTFINLQSRIGSGDTKLILSIGGTDAVGSGGFNTIAADPTITALFVSRVKSLLNEWNADGVDIDWEKWLKTTENSNDHEAFMKALHDTLSPEGYTIFTDVPASNWNGQWFNIKAADYVDYIQPMAYTFSGSWSAVTGHNSSFAQSTGALDYWVGRGVPASKLVLGVPFYGIGFGGTDQIGAEFTGNSSLGEFVDYTAVLTALESGEYEHSTEEYIDAPYIYSSDKNEIIFYNDTTVVRKKAEYLVENEYAGAMIWELGQDPNDEMSLLNVLAETLLGWEGSTVSTIEQRNVDPISAMTAHLSNNTLSLSVSNSASVNFSLFDAHGRQIKKINRLQFSNGTAQVSLNGLATGVYFVKVATLDGVQSVASFINR